MLQNPEPNGLVDVWKTHVARDEECPIVVIDCDGSDGIISDFGAKVLSSERKFALRRRSRGDLPNAFAFRHATREPSSMSDQYGLNFGHGCSTWNEENRIVRSPVEPVSVSEGGELDRDFKNPAVRTDERCDPAIHAFRAEESGSIPNRFVDGSRPDLLISVGSG